MEGCENPVCMAIATTTTTIKIPVAFMFLPFKNTTLLIVEGRSSWISSHSISIFSESNLAMALRQAIINYSPLPTG